MKTVDVNKCQRCGQDHAQVDFELLANPADEFTHWALCPVSQQPILLAEIDEPLILAKLVFNPDNQRCAFATCGHAVLIYAQQIRDLLATTHAPAQLLIRSGADHVILPLKDPVST
jgi:hypothetical protein